MSNLSIISINNDLTKKFDINLTNWNYRYTSPQSHILKKLIKVWLYGSYGLFEWCPKENYQYIIMKKKSLFETLESATDKRLYSM